MTISKDTALQGFAEHRIQRAHVKAISASRIGKSTLDLLVSLSAAAVLIGGSSAAAAQTATKTPTTKFLAIAFR
jgi:hypothetical protein